MTNNRYVDVTLILDESGSMAPLQEETITSLNKFLDDQKKVPGDCLLSVIKFNGNQHPLFLGRTIQNVRDFTKYNYTPNGYTALLDAVGVAIDETGSRLRLMPEPMRPGKVIFVIVTDGQENMSYKYTKQQIKDAIERQSSQYQWEFIYMGANVDAFAEASSLGISRMNTIATYDQYTKDMVGAHGHSYHALSTNLAAVRTSGKADMSWESKQIEDQNAIMNNQTTGGTVS
jgi:hypothetical protein